MTDLPHHIANSLSWSWIHIWINNRIRLLELRNEWRSREWTPGFQRIRRLKLLKLSFHSLVVAGLRLMLTNLAIGSKGKLIRKSVVEVSADYSLGKTFILFLLWLPHPLSSYEHSSTSLMRCKASTIEWALWENGKTGGVPSLAMGTVPT